MQIEAKRIRTAKELSKILEAQAKTVKGFADLAARPLRLLLLGACGGGCSRLGDGEAKTELKGSKSFDMRERVLSKI